MAESDDDCIVIDLKTLQEDSDLEEIEVVDIRPAKKPRLEDKYNWPLSEDDLPIRKPSKREEKEISIASLSPGLVISPSPALSLKTEHQDVKIESTQVVGKNWPRSALAEHRVEHTYSWPISEDDLQFKPSESDEKKINILPLSPDPEVVISPSPAPSSKTMRLDAQTKSDSTQVKGQNWSGSGLEKSSLTPAPSLPSRPRGTVPLAIDDPLITEEVVNVRRSWLCLLKRWTDL